jgi:hypothetical protein
MAVKDAIIIMISFATFLIALLTYIAMNYKRKYKPTPRLNYNPQNGQFEEKRPSFGFLHL